VHIYLIRHADPDYERDSLTEQGFREAAALAGRLEALGVTRVYSSTASRALLTARAYAEPRSLAVESFAWLLEPTHLQVEQGGRRYSLWDTFGETVRGGPAVPTQETWSRSAPFHTPEVQEMWRAFRGNADSLLARHGFAREGGRYRVTRPGRERIAVVSHNGTVLLWLAHLLELPLSLVYCGFYSWPASVTTVFMETHSDAWAVPRALNVADVSHLVAAGITPRPRAIGPEPYEPYL
jgi:broad specificity phosphatase PhoE